MRERRIRIANELAVQVMTTGWRSGNLCCVSGIPDDAFIVQAYMAESHWVGPNDIMIVVRSDTWPDWGNFDTFAPTYQRGEAIQEEC